MSQKINLRVVILIFLLASSPGQSALAADYPKQLQGKWRLSAGDESCTDPFQFNKAALLLPGGGVCKPTKIQRMNKNKFKIIETCQSGPVQSQSSMTYSVTADVLTIVGPTERQLNRCSTPPSMSGDTQPTAID
jgi:subtilisin-like proprotein convertase family protein